MGVNILTILLSLCCSKIGQKQVKKVSSLPRAPILRKLLPSCSQEVTPSLSTPRAYLMYFFLQEYPICYPIPTILSFKLVFEPISPTDFTGHYNSHSSPSLQVATILIGEKLIKQLWFVARHAVSRMFCKHIQNLQERALSRGVTLWNNNL